MKRTDYNFFTQQDTLEVIKNFAFKYTGDTDKFKNIPIRDFFKYVACKIKYVKDPEGIELVQRPLVTMKRRKGDCDCKATLFLSYLINKKIPCGVSIVSEKKNKNYHHIFPFIFNNNKIYDIDATYCKNIIYDTRSWIKRKNIIIYDGV